MTTYRTREEAEQARAERTSPCKSCKGPVQWVVTVAGKRMPLDPDPVIGGNVARTGKVVDGMFEVVVVENSSRHRDRGTGTRWVSHFSSCPNAGAHRRPKAEG